MTVFRMDVHRQSGEVWLWMEAPCGSKPIMGWADLEGVKEFAEMLLSFYNGGKRKEEKDRIRKISDKLLKQALSNDEYF